MVEVRSWCEREGRWRCDNLRIEDKDGVEEKVGRRGVGA